MSKKQSSQHIWMVFLIICSLAVIIFQFLFSQWTSSDFKSEMELQRKSSVRKMVNVAYNTIKPICNQVLKGEISKEEALMTIRNLVRQMTYQDDYGDNYIFMSSYDGTMLVQPFEPEKEGTNQWELKDADGYYIIQNLIKAAKEKPEGSFLTYHYYPPNKKVAEEKLSYVVGIPEIDAYIGTGMYIESTYKELQNILKNQRFGFQLITFFIFIMIAFYIQELMQSNRHLKKEIIERNRQYEELTVTQTELQKKHDELTSIYEELAATEEELRLQHDENKKNQEEITHLAYFDYLTDLPNRVFMVNMLNAKMKKQGTGSGCVCYIDVDNFKDINDTFGHFYGDQVLVELSKKLKALPVEQLFIARIGGDEFIVQKDFAADDIDIEWLSNQILTIFSQPIQIDEIIFQLTCSMGIALYPQNGKNVEDILKSADLAMYQAKLKGKNRFIFYSTHMAQEHAERTEFEKQLREGLKNNEFELYYQPIIKIKNGRIAGLEALLRWNSPVYGMVLPGKFIPVAEEIGLINEIGSWVLDKSFEFASTLKGTDICVSCNISSIQLQQPGFVNEVVEAFGKYELDVDSVSLEVTESILIESFEEIILKLNILRQYGIQVYLDDFGKGYSSLTYLKNLPIDVVKIDKLFIDSLAQDGDEKRIVKSIIALAHDLGLKVISEGVETDDQKEVLTTYKCNYYQGYLFSRPKPVSEIRQMILNQENKA